MADHTPSSRLEGEPGAGPGCAGYSGARDNPALHRAVRPSHPGRDRRRLASLARRPRAPRLAASGQVAQAAGVNLQTLRYYERRGLLTPPERPPGGHRQYVPEVVTLLRVIKAAQRLGFTLDEVADLLQTGQHRHGQPPDAGLAQQARAKLTEVDAKIADLHTIRAALEAGCQDPIACAGIPSCPLPFAGLADQGLEQPMGRTTHSRQSARSRRRLWLGLAGTAVVIAVLAVVALTLVGGPTGGSAGAGAADATVDATRASIGKPFPQFTLTGADREAVTGTARSGRPSIVWFTDAACVPCQLGAVKVAQLDDQLGGHAFSVVTVFVNPHEPLAALTAWGDRYAQPDWTVALDARGALSSTVRLQYLDTKFLLDADGRIFDVNPFPVNADYLRLLRTKVEG
jgi:MerR family mercuric resistance operon transcriptional regulator